MVYMLNWYNLRIYLMQLLVLVEQFYNHLYLTSNIFVTHNCEGFPRIKNIFPKHFTSRLCKSKLFDKR